MRTDICALLAACLACLPASPGAGADDLARSFAAPPESARPGVYWYFMDGNLSREGMTRDLESMKEAGLGHLVFLEVNVGVPRGPVDFLSGEWQDLFAHAVREAERLGIEITLGAGPGWTGSGGPWVKPGQSMQHLVAAEVEVEGPGPFTSTLPVPPPRRPFFGDVPGSMRPQWEAFFRDVAVLAHPTPAHPAAIPDVDEKALVYRAPFSSQPNVKPRLDAPAEFPADPPGSAIPPGQILDLSPHLRPDGTLDWQIPKGRWTVLRFVSRNNGASTRPAPEPGIGFESDKFDAAALDAHLEAYAVKLLERVGPRQPGRGWTMLHMDSWEMGAQNWTGQWREQFLKRRGYDPQPFYPACLGRVVDSRERSERFLWDLRATAQELVLENHATHLKEFGRKHGFTLSIEPYDMNPCNDFDLGAVADVPMCEFWSLGFDTAYSCHTASSIAHVLGRPVVAAEAVTADHREAWRFHPGSLKNQGDWAFATGINRLTYHTFAHKPDSGRPGMVMGPYGVHWDRGQTWWPMVADYHRYISRCQYLLRQGRAVANILYLMPEGAPNVFQPPPSAFAGTNGLPDRRGYNFDGCSALTLMELAKTSAGCVVFPSGASYEILVLPNCDTMTPELLRKVKSLVKSGATVIGNPPRRSPSLEHYPECDRVVEREATALWGSLTPPGGTAIRKFGRGRILCGMDLASADSPSPHDQPGGPAQSLYPRYDLAARFLRDAGVPEDFSCPAPLRYAHRRLENLDLYFVANACDQAIETTAAFRADQGPPELWNPLDGTRRKLPEYQRDPGSPNRAMPGITRIPLRLEPFGSFFIVFPRGKARLPAAPNVTPQNFPTYAPVKTLQGPWEVSFDPAMGAPARATFETLQDWTQRPEPGIQHYSGIATYRAKFELPPDSVSAGGRPLWLDLGAVEVMARVRLNGADCGAVWTAPRRVDISRAVRAGANLLEIEVANLWPNRMIGDAAATGAKFTRTTFHPWKASDPLLPSGLHGPVRLIMPDARTAQ